MRMNHGVAFSFLGAVLLAAACGGDDEGDKITDGGQSVLCRGITCSSHGHCIALNGQAACSCDDGYRNQDLLTCVDDPCFGITCSDHGTCGLSGGSPVCQCEDGYQAAGSECIEVVAYAGACRARLGMNNACVDYTGSRYSVGTVLESCRRVAGTYSRTGCPAANRSGSCTTAGGTVSERVIYYYFVDDTTDLESSCTDGGGAWAD